MGKDKEFGIHDEYVVMSIRKINHEELINILKE